MGQKKPRYITKQLFLNSVVCPALGWLMRIERVSKPATMGEKFRMEQGLEVGKRARELWPDGALVEKEDLQSAVENTAALMGNPATQAIFEATFMIDSYIAKADILDRTKDGWHLVEVKSSLNDKAEFIGDMAYTGMVVQRSGYGVSNVSLMLISKEFRLGMPNESLFVQVDHRGEVLEAIDGFGLCWEEIERITRQPEMPEPKLQFECRTCPLFKECLGKNVENPIFEIPRIRQAKFAGLVEQGIMSIEGIPRTFSLTENQSRVRACVQSKKPFVAPSLAGELGSVHWPAFYLDFETVLTAIPLYPDIAPYAQIPTQYSIHRCPKPGQVDEHFEYLASPQEDCRRELAERLIEHLKGEGSIIVYSNFEKTIIKSLIDVCPDLSQDLSSLIDRMVDLQAIIRRNFYHPDFHGSLSIKRVLPVLVSDLSYEALEIGDGDAAIATFAWLAHGKFDKKEAEAAKRNLLEYCKQDTLAMVKLHQRLIEYAAGSGL